MSHTTDAIDKLFLELSQFTRATTGKEIYMETVISKQQDTIQQLERQNAELAGALESALESRLDIDYSRDGSIYTMLSKAKILELFNILSKHKEAQLNHRR